MNTNIDIKELDSMIMREIVHDIISGTLLLEADDETLDLMLLHVWEMKEYFQSIGVVIGEA